MPHDRDKLDKALAWLDANAITAWLFGGWAEQLRGLCPPRPHADVDLLLPAEDFAALDALIRCRALDEIDAKRAVHKRAIVLTGVMIEFFLVQRDQRGACTNFWGRSRFDWPDDVLGQLDGRRTASAAALRGYRAAHRRLHAAPIMSGT